MGIAIFDIPIKSYRARDSSRSFLLSIGIRKGLTKIMLNDKSKDDLSMLFMN